MYKRRAKRLTLCVLTVAMTVCLPSHAENLDEIQDNYEQALGLCAADGMSTGVGVSMMGWGLAIIIGITILAIVLHQSAGGTTHSDTTTTTPGSTNNAAADTGIGATL